jgi:hypothetical protein
MSNLDPELKHQLEAAPSVQAVLRLRCEHAGRTAPPPDETEKTARRVLERVREELGVEPKAFNIFRNLGYFVVDAETPFIRRLIEQEEIASASANVRRASPSAPPSPSKR